jgi:hypothetical protein
MYPSIHTPTSRTDQVSPVNGEASTSVVPSHDLRQLGLATASRQLRAHVADLDSVFVARARSDLRQCPVCLVSHEA